MFKKISLFFFFFFAIVGVYVIFLPKILVQLGYTSFQIGVIFSTAPLVRFILPFIFRKYIILDKKIFYLSLVNLVLTGLFFYISVKNFWLFLVANIFFGVSMGIILPFIESFSLKFLKKQKYGRSRLFGSLGFIFITIILAKFLKDPFVGLDFLFVTMLISAISAFFIVSKNNHFKSSDKKSTLNLRLHIKFWISLFLLQVSFGGYYNFFTIYESSLGVNLETISFMWTFGVICEILFFYFQAPILKAFHLPKLISFSFFITMLRWLMLYIFPNSIALTFLSQSLHAISFALLHSAAFSHLYVLYKNNPLAGQFYYGIAFGLGGFVGSIIGGIAYGEYLYLVCAFIAFLAFIIYKKEDCRVHEAHKLY